jgi:hypothetical protein
VSRVDVDVVGRGSVNGRFAPRNRPSATLIPLAIPVIEPPSLLASVPFVL